LLKNYNKRVILYPAGSSGYFLAAFLITGHDHVLPNNRIDLGQKLSSTVFVTSDPLNDYDSEECLLQIKDEILHGHRQSILSHYSKISQLKEFESTNWIKKIVPDTNIFGWIKNIVYKKKYTEFIDLRNTPLRHQVDGTFLDLITWYDFNQKDYDKPSDMTIDFGRICNIQYLIDLYESANGVKPTDERLKFAEDYISKQFPPLGDCDSTSIVDVINHVNPQDPFDIATVLFIYEKNHNTLDTNRLWSINDIPNTVPDSIEFLISNERNYSIF
jgi:hypothetical protein